MSAVGVGVPDVDRFWARVNKGADDDCWTWAGELQNKGYGVFYTYGNGKRVKHLAHRYSVSLVTELIPGLVCMHSCDNPPCVNPRHITQGTQLDNIRDAKAKGRMDMSGLELGWALRRGASPKERRAMRSDAA